MEIKSNTVEAPRIYIENDEIQIIFFDNKSSSFHLLKEACNNLIDALVILYSFYFSFDIKLVNLSKIFLY
jgi:hypothetical protein